MGTTCTRIGPRVVRPLVSRPVLRIGPGVGRWTVSQRACTYNGSGVGRL